MRGTAAIPCQQKIHFRSVRWVLKGAPPLSILHPRSLWISNRRLATTIRLGWRGVSELINFRWAMRYRVMEVRPFHLLIPLN